MKVGRGKTTLEIRLTDEEYAALGSPRCSVMVDIKSVDRWITIAGEERGRYQISRVGQGNARHPYKVTVAQPATAIPVFGMELVSCRTGEGFIYGSKPGMDAEVRVREPGAEKAPPTDKLRAAVKVINDAKAVYGDQMSMSIKDDKLTINVMLEI